MTLRSATIIHSARATPVRVPAKPDSLNSPGVDEKDPAFAAKFKTGAAWSEFHREPKWIIELTTQDGLVGIGETYRGATRESVEAIITPLLGTDVLRLNWRRLPFDEPRAYDAAESAVLDIAGKALGVPVHQLLGGSFRDRVECNGWTGRRTPADAGRKAREALQRGHRIFKFKCADNDNVAAWMQEIRRQCGDQIKIVLDPNQRWKDVATTMRLMEGVPRDMMLGLEDPIDRQDYRGMRELRERLGIPLIVHVSLPYRHQGQRAVDLIEAMRERCADAFNFNGPMVDFVRLAETAALEGFTCWHGSEVDLGILEVSALHAAAASSLCTIPCDIFGELVRENDLIEPGIVFERGSALVPQGPGLGVSLDQAALARYRAGDTLEFKDGNVRKMEHA